MSEANKKSDNATNIKITETVTSKQELFVDGTTIIGGFPNSKLRFFSSEKTKDTSDNIVENRTVHTSVTIPSVALLNLAMLIIQQFKDNEALLSDAGDQYKNDLINKLRAIGADNVPKSEK